MFTNQEHQTFTQLINKSLGVVCEVTLNMENLVLTSFFVKVNKMNKENLKYKNIKRYLLKIARKTGAIMIHSNLVHRGNHSKEKYLLARFQEWGKDDRSEEHTSELQSRFDLVCRLLLEKKKKKHKHIMSNNIIYTEQ